MRARRYDAGFNKHQVDEKLRLAQTAGGIVVKDAKHNISLGIIILHNHHQPPQRARTVTYSVQAGTMH